MCYCPVSQVYIRGGKLHAANRSMPCCHRREICTGPHTSSLSGRSDRFVPNFCCCVAAYTFTNDVSNQVLLSGLGPPAIGKQRAAARRLPCSPAWVIWVIWVIPLYASTAKSSNHQGMRPATATPLSGTSQILCRASAASGHTRSPMISATECYYKVVALLRSA